MLSGKMRHRFDVERRTTTQDTFGEEQYQWSTLLTGRWCRVNWGSGSEPTNGPGQSPVTNVTFIARYDTTLATVTQADRIVFQSQYYDIKSIINPDSRNESLQFYCELNVRQQ